MRGGYPLPAEADGGVGVTMNLSLLGSLGSRMAMRRMRHLVLSDRNYTCVSAAVASARNRPRRDVAAARTKPLTQQLLTEGDCSRIERDIRPKRANSVGLHSAIALRNCAECPLPARGAVMSL